jgi:hypothetical protein
MRLEAIAKVLTACAPFIWPLVFLVVIFRYHKQIMNIYFLCCQQISAGAALKFGTIEIHGADLTKPEDREGANYRREPAGESFLADRDSVYKYSKNLMLVHRIRPRGEMHEIVKLPVYDIWVYLIPHKNLGKINDVKAVEYYLGKYFGRSESEFGV